jgi:hypothetical protein
MSQSSEELETCDTCGIGHFRPMTGPGRTALYRRGLRVDIPENVPMLTCDHCGQRLMDESIIHLITEIGRAKYPSPLTASGRR